MRYLRLFAVMVLLAGAVLMVSSAHEDLGTPGMAKALAERAATVVTDQGKEAAIVILSSPKSEFIQGSLYVFAMDLDGMMLAHPHNPKLIGRSFMGERDFNGVAYGREFVNTAKTDGSGWVDYVFTDPMSHKLMRKSTYILRIGDILVGCGYYTR
ncbi:MAG: cache domain-containing protein [Rhodospirillaceae bacterium]|nr:cache domain-containing protein [Rhodospirillaceae bacterium]